MGGEHWEPLAPTLRVLVSDTHKFSTDTLLLAHFAAPRKGELAADLGTGCGVIPLLWAGRSAPAHVTALELQADAAELARRSVEENGLGEKIQVVRGDLREYKRYLPHQGLGLIACNPPYFSPGTGLAPADPARAQARQAGTLTLTDLAQAARYALKFGGRLCFCLPVPRLAEAMAALGERGLEPKRLRLVQRDPRKAPYLFLLECRLGSRPGLAAEPTLCICGEDGEYTPEMQEIYGDYTI